MISAQFFVVVDGTLVVSMERYLGISRSTSVVGLSRKDALAICKVKAITRSRRSNQLVLICMLISVDIGRSNHRVHAIGTVRAILKAYLSAGLSFSKVLRGMLVISWSAASSRVKAIWSNLSMMLVSTLINHIFELAFQKCGSWHQRDSHELAR